MYYTIYQIVNKINQKIYVGKHITSDLCDDYMGSGKILRKAQEKYGIENFEKQILFVFDSEEEMNAMEKEIVNEEFCLRADNYNLCVGGQGGFSYINRESKNLYGKNGQSGFGLENLLRGYQLKDKLTADGKYEDWKLNISNSLCAKYMKDGHHWNGKKHKEESKHKIGEKVSVSQSGNKNSQFGSKWVTNGTENKKIKAIDFIPDGWYNGRVVKKNSEFR